MANLKPHATLPDWAFRALAAHAIDSLIDRTEHETLLVTRRGRPDLVLVSHEEWERLATARRRGHADAAREAGTAEGGEP